MENQKKPEIPESIRRLCPKITAIVEKWDKLRVDDRGPDLRGCLFPIKGILMRVNRSDSFQVRLCEPVDDVRDSGYFAWEGNYAQLESVIDDPAPDGSRLLHLVDLAWQKACGSEEVPSTKLALGLLADAGFGGNSHREGRVVFTEEVKERLYERSAAILTDLLKETEKERNEQNEPPGGGDGRPTGR